VIRVFLIGPPGSGKTSVGQALSEILDCDFFDTDRLIEARTGKTVTEIFAESGETQFRLLERELLQQIETVPVKSAKAVIFATGGGLPIYNDNIKLLSTLGKVVALHADIPVLAQRLLGDRGRPLLAANGAIEADMSEEEHLQRRLTELMETRWPVYAQAGYKINTSGLSALEVANDILRVLGRQSLTDNPL
jgi:shikimate kinase